MIDEQGKGSRGQDEELKPEGVVVVVISGLELGVHEVHGTEGGQQVDDLCR